MAAKTVKKPASRDKGIRHATQHAAALFKMVADPTRLGILMILFDGAKNVTEICAAVCQSQPATSHHLALLRASKLVEADREGKNNFYTLTEDGVKLVEVTKTLAD